MKRIIATINALLVVSNTVGYSQEYSEDYAKAITKACYELVDPGVMYDSRYVKISYPMGDVPSDRGVCTDAVIRAFRKIGYDFQEEVHRSMLRNREKNNNLIINGKEFEVRPYTGEVIDSNINHRRVWTLAKFLKYSCYPWRCCVVPWEAVSVKSKKFPAGTVIIWDMGGGQGHIGIVIDGEYCFHQVCCGQVIEPVLHAWKIVGAYYMTGGYYYYLNNIE